MLCPLMLFVIRFMIVPGMKVCSSFLISVCMFIVSKALLISSAIVIVHAGIAIWFNPFIMCGLVVRVVALRPRCHGFEALRR